MTYAIIYMVVLILLAALHDKDDLLNDDGGNVMCLIFWPLIVTAMLIVAPFALAIGLGQGLHYLLTRGWRK